MPSFSTVWPVNWFSVKRCDSDNAAKSGICPGRSLINLLLPKDINMSRGEQRAPFIVIEGLDRSGKTTQTGALHTRLQDEGIDATLIKFPGK